jgi:hypothetical protein
MFLIWFLTFVARQLMDNIDIIFDELKRNEIDIDKQTLSFHINTMINQHRGLQRDQCHKFWSYYCLFSFRMFTKL